MGTLIPLRDIEIDPDDPISHNDVPGSQVYTVRQVATLLGINLGVTYELIRHGEIPRSDSAGDGSFLGDCSTPG